MPHLLSLIREDVGTVLDRDPAAKSRLEVYLCYSGLHAVWFYRMNHWLWNHGFFFWRAGCRKWRDFLTGIEIHPGAQIGRRFFIDHGMGVVIGETAVVGEDVTLYQGVTLGGTGKEHGKRHPTLLDNVVVGGGAQRFSAISRWVATAGSARDRWCYEMCRTTLRWSEFRDTLSSARVNAS